MQAGGRKGMTVREMREAIRLHHRPSRLIAVQARDDIRRAINLMQIYSISQLPVLDGEHIVGSLDERELMQQVMGAAHCLWGAVSGFMQPPLPSLEEAATVAQLYELLRQGVAGVIVTRDGVPIGIVTPADLVALKVYSASAEYEI